MGHFCENAPGRPEIDSEGVGFLAEKNFGAAVPESYDFVSISLDGQAKGSRKTKIGKFDLSSCGVNQQILWLEISVEDSVLMEVDEGV